MKVVFTLQTEDSYNLARPIKKHQIVVFTLQTEDSYNAGVKLLICGMLYLPYKLKIVTTVPPLSFVLVCCIYLTN